MSDMSHEAAPAKARSVHFNRPGGPGGRYVWRAAAVGTSGPVGAMGGSGADLAAVFAWGHAGLGPELAVEVGQVLVTGVEADVGDGPVGLKQHRARPDDPQP